MKVEKLFLRNFLIIEKAAIELSNGMTTVTGETGSGKSLFISAMKALKGHRVTKDLVGRWNDTGEISAEIVIEKEDLVLREKCEKYSVYLEDNRRLVVKRVFGAKTGAYINDLPVSVALLADIFGDHIEIGSQFENRELFKKDYRLSVLDAFIKNSDKLKEYQEVFREMKELETEISELRLTDDPGKRDYIEYQINELVKLETWEGEDVELAQKISFIENKSKILNLGKELDEILDSTTDKAQRAADIIDDLAKLSDVKGLDERIKSAAIEFSDIKRSFSVPDHDFEDEDPEEMRKRYDRVSSMLMKHSSADTGELLEKLEKMQFELEDLNEVPKKISKLTKELKKVQLVLDEKADALRETRLEGAPELEKKISGYLKKFGMEGVNLKVNVEKTESPGESGIDDVKFRINTTGSQKHSDISTLSGGELSRFLLSVKLVDREKGRLLLFDEIDSSIGGETARDASMEMKKNSKFNQIVVVTHFPQTAASADEHLVVEKKVSGGKVSANVRKLYKDEKTRELARMMGDSNSGRFNDTASEMLKEG